MDIFNGVAFKHGMANTAIKLSLHSVQLVAVASAQNFGIVGAGQAQVFTIQNNSFQ